MSSNTIFFDMGYTLAFPYPSWTDVYHKAYRDAGLHIDRDTLHEVLEAVWRAVIAEDATAAWEASEAGDLRRKWEIEREILDRLGLKDDHRQIFDRVTAAFRDPANYRLFPEVPDTLRALRDQGYTLAIVSNWDWHLPALCNDLNLTPYFDAIITSARVGRAKPHPQIFHTALAETGAEPERTLHVGDSYDADVVGAQGVGIAGVLIDREGVAKTDGHLTIQRLDELLSLLDRA
jgi:putative hydrolase of the HAD superfamily